MKTNIINSGADSKIPAGIFSGTELFAKGDNMYAMYQGCCLCFEDLPDPVRQLFVDMYFQDLEGQKFIRKYFGIIDFESSFKKWLFCKFGSLDSIPDNINDSVVPDKYNSACCSLSCCGRGKFCGIESGLKGYEIATLKELKAGRTSREIADSLCISEPAVKSRIEKLKGKFNVANAVALIATVSELGV